MSSKQRAFIINWFSCYKILQLAFLMGSLITESFDVSTPTLASDSGSRSLIHVTVLRLINWDAVYFYKLFNNEPNFEHEFVFSPFWTTLVRQLPVEDPILKFIVAGIVTNILHLANALLIYEISKEIRIRADFKTSSSSKFELVSALIYVVLPAGAFVIMPYSEVFNSFLCFTGLLLKLKSASKDGELIERKLLYLVSAIFFGIAFQVRSNSVLYGILYLIDLVQRRQRIALFAGASMGLLVAINQFVPYYQFCRIHDFSYWADIRSSGDDFDIDLYDLGRPEWCHSKLPFLTLHAQATYWNNGFLRYWTLNNIPNFLIGLPTVLVLLASVSHKYQHQGKLVTDLKLITIVFVFLNVTCWHVQIINRVSNFIPINCWMLAEMILDDSPQRKVALGVIVYYIAWNLTQTSLYSSFLPPA
ncbi:Glycosyl phosphatidyl inositol biosynthesis mannosyltransferase [Komagataella phaffii CBS 7435]|uniref:GPI mannosyltransferase 2 n=2 Tax=Komagataella phaffii TaxID=460519 RepID=C4R9F9_KOMPG|nr:GQ67_01387T0 [Komagataella phaffii]AOA65810.1 GQ68_01403T0 [Komagataella phaffii GS115]CAH2447436.1 Glycosyl phosphatidyl inositol biosynthesis mannosyltransferase [Komagataella phaffii CBS 7435]CAY67054.1 GPI mannosyltransferase [Komagataella pastoris]SCV11954.1 Glycosyl phosphatidyl inositol biosynthesis mannosyltransferase [Komagataella phaffii CBS 7435]